MNIATEVQDKNLIHDGCDNQSVYVQRDFSNSRPLDVHTWSEHLEVHALIADLWADYFAVEFDNAGRPGRRAAGSPIRQFRVLVLDLYLAWKSDPGMSIGVGMSNRFYRSGSRYNALHISSVMIKLVHRAHEVGLIGLHLGTEYAGRTTRIWAAPQLVERFARARFGVFDIAPYSERESIILSRGDRERWEEYDDNDWTHAMRATMSSYNALIDQTFIDIPTLDLPIITRAQENTGRATQVRIDQNNKFSRRVFYRGSWELGGRVHGGFWQQLPEPYRASLWINDLPVIEDDYSGLHIALLYGMEGRPLVGDPYSLGISTAYPPEALRGWIKQLVLVAINAGTEASAFKAFRQKQAPGSPAKRFTDRMLGELLEAFKSQHKAISQYMCSDEGVRLMAIDGRITARIIERFSPKSRCRC
ncbi:hypothetical protein [Devosia sp. SD17-2]|uniref:hypothetical protein n=1 Tax=Devosia sp. SD17-2 TaxID=2976459 RepID=UPI0023D84D07|nr:hypothetical protein [Devosia sp. SD17-2]WEJ31631.1 hypothetical protein NYQ88_11995 [Devosia sp. SD17-2]